MRDLKNKRVLITGGTSMLGRHISERLKDEGAIPLPLRHDTGCDLMESDDTIEVFQALNPEYVIHCAGYNGNIEMNKREPTSIFYRTAQMALNVLSEAAIRPTVKKVVSLVSSCSYPDGLEVLREEDFLSGAPHPSVEAHGFSKRILFEYSRQLKKQFDFTSVCCVLNTCFGPYDSYDLNKTKVVGSLIKRFVDAKEEGKDEVTLWGSGQVRRELCYAADAAVGVVNVLKYYEDTELPINWGVGWDITIKDLAELVCYVVGYTGKIKWDVSKPDGQRKKLLDVSRARKLLPSHNFRILFDSLSESIQWYKNHRPF
jgi:GDP-L-fucose synthase